MFHRLGSVLAAIGLMLVVAFPVAAAPPEQFEENVAYLFPDLERGLVILVNTTRDQYCTPEVIDWELAVVQWQSDWIAWDEGGQVGPEPPFPDDPLGGFPEGIDPVLTQVKETGQGALVLRQQARDLVAEIWPLVEDAPLIGPCLDTDASDTPLVGTADYQRNDNDLLGSGTRGNAFGEWGTIKGKTATGGRFSYSWRFHVNSRCYTPDDGEPACLIDESSFRMN